jgi:hypothetical protein
MEVVVVVPVGITHTQLVLAAQVVVELEQNTTKQLFQVWLAVLEPQTQVAAAEPHTMAVREW